MDTNAECKSFVEQIAYIYLYKHIKAKLNHGIRLKMITKLYICSLYVGSNVLKFVHVYVLEVLNIL